MSIHETRYRIDIESLQSVLGAFPPQTSLTITSEGVTLAEHICSGQVDSELHGSGPIAKKLDDVVEQFYNEE